MFLQVENDCIDETHRLLFLTALHELVDLDTLEGTDLPYVIFKSCESTTHTNHDRVRLDHESMLLRTDHVLALINAWRPLFHLNHW